jgi:hypothetical protein
MRAGAFGVAAMLILANAIYAANDGFEAQHTHVQFVP